MGEKSQAKPTYSSFLLLSVVFVKCPGNQRREKLRIINLPPWNCFSSGGKRTTRLRMVVRKSGPQKASKVGNGTSADLLPHRNDRTCSREHASTVPAKSPAVVLFMDHIKLPPKINKLDVKVPVLARNTYDGAGFTSYPARSAYVCTGDGLNMSVSWQCEPESKIYLLCSLGSTLACSAKC